MKRVDWFVVTSWLGALVFCAAFWWMFYLDVRWMLGLLTK